MRHQRVPEWASQETASGLQNGCRVFAHCTDLLPASYPTNPRDHVDHGHPRQPAENHLRRDARERCARAARVLRGLPLKPLDRRQCRSMARRGAAVRHRAAVHHQPRELETDWMSVPPFTSIAEHRERRIAYESIPDLLVHRDRCTAKVLGRSPGIAEIDRPTSIAEGDAHVESPGGISPPGAPRTVHDPLESHGSRCSAVAVA